MITTKPQQPERTALYRLYDADDQLLYVGISSDPPSRMQQHASDKLWWPEVAHHTITWLTSRSEALAAERAAINSEHPCYNHVHKQSSILPFIKNQRLNDRQSGQPWTPHQMMAGELRGFVQSGALRPGDRFPTTGELVAAYGVSNVTVQRALKLLKSEGFARSRMGSGVYAALPPGFRRGEDASLGLSGHLEGAIDLLPVSDGRSSASLGGRQPRPGPGYGASMGPLSNWSSTTTIPTLPHLTDLSAQWMSFGPRCQPPKRLSP
ncbi:GntR family transcriptional regulator [Streptomyces ambofaciens]